MPAGSPVFGPKDSLSIWDGRSETNYNAMRKLVLQVIRPYKNQGNQGGALNFARRCPAIVRQYYNNNEFSPSGYAKISRGRHPDPLGNLMLVRTKEFIMPTRASLGTSSIVVADNRSRGWSNLRLKTLARQKL